MVEEAEYKMGANYCFTIYGGNRALTVAASNQEEKDKWLEDLQTAINDVRDRGEEKLQYLSLKSCSEYFCNKQKSKVLNIVSIISRWCSITPSFLF